MAGCEVLVAWVGVIDMEGGLMGYQFLEPGEASDMPLAQVAGTMTFSHATADGGMWAFRPEPWVDADWQQAIARNWARFSEKISDINRGIRGEN